MSTDDQPRPLYFEAGERIRYTELIRFLYRKLVDDDYHSRLPKDGPVHRGLRHARRVATQACRGDYRDGKECAAELRGLAAGARMHNGTPRTQAQVNFFEDVQRIAWCSMGPGWGSPEDRARVDYLFEVQKRGNFFIPETA